MTLYLVGAGVAFDFTLGAMDALGSCEEIFIETYTTLMDEADILAFEEKIGKNIVRLDRSIVESKFLIEKAESGNVCLISSGDPLTATTHIALVIDAKKKGIKVKVVHNSSIYSVAPAKAGLQIYRFGKTASLVNPRPKYNPKSSLDIIRKNLENDMHSLVLLDTEPTPMSAKTALSMLSEFQDAVVLSRLGFVDERITYGKVGELLGRNLGRPPFTIIIPAKLHPMEWESLSLLL